MQKMYVKICKLLFHLGATTNFKGFYQTVYAVQLAIQQPELLMYVSKLLYPEVAKTYHTNWCAVERNIRTIRSFVWEENRPLLEKLAHRTLASKPTASQFISILALSLQFDELDEVLEVIAPRKEDSASEDQIS